MSKCPKCGCTKILGPVYIPPKFGPKTERLKYQCFQCGYITTTPTLDNK